MSTFGVIEVREQIWRSGNCSYIRVLASRIGVSNRGYSGKVKRAATDFGVEHSFAKAKERLFEHYDIELSVSAMRQITLEQCQRAKQKLESEYKRSFRLLPAKGAAHVIAEADGTMIRTVEKGRRKQARPREWKEMRLVAACEQGRIDPCYGATFSDVSQVGQRWGHCARNAGWGLQSSIHVVADGAPWIENQSREVFGSQARFLLDYYHVGEYLANAAESCRPKAPQAWRKTQQKRLKRGAVQPVLQELYAHMEGAIVADEQAPVRSACRYLDNRIEQLDYPRAIKLELPIGSGLIESGHRHVLQARLKQPGAAWLRENADAIAQLRVLRSNRQWLCLWN